MAGVNVVHVPYKGGGLAVTGLVGGEVQMMILNMVSTKSHVPSGRLRPLAVAAKKRSPHLPDVPTAAEAGLPGYEYWQWYGLFAPRGTPNAFLTRLEAEFKRLAELPAVRTKLAHQGADTYSETPQQLAAFVRQDIEKNRKIAQAANIRTD